MDLRKGCGRFASYKRFDAEYLPTSW